MRAVVMGGSGQIGGWLMNHLAERGHEAFGTYTSVPCEGLSCLDAADPEAAGWVRDQRPDVVFYPAGFTWVDGCEHEPDRSNAVNLEQPLRLARAAVEVGARFVYFSSDYVFSGHAGPYDEDAPPSPLQIYGRSKWEAEQALAVDLGDRLLIARTCWVYGPERQGKNFAYQVVRTLSAGETLVCPSDQRSNPSYGPDVALAAVRLVEGGHSGVFHVAGPEVMDRVDFARALASGFGLDPNLVVGELTAALGQGAPRPLDGGLSTARLDALFPGLMRPVGVAVADFRSRAPGPEGWRDPFIV